MDDTADTWSEQKASWKLLSGLRARPIDLELLALVAEKTNKELLQPGVLEQLLCELGLNDEGMEEFPDHLYRYCGRGLRLWQYPIQFAPYLRFIVKQRVRSYLEIGVRHGGSFVTTAEILRRFGTLDFSVAVDIIQCPSLADYSRIFTSARFECMNSQGDGFKQLLAQLAPIDLVFIDSHHKEGQCRREFEVIREFADIIAFHDVSNRDCPGVAKVWEEIRSCREYRCFEFKRQYEGLGPFMGIGVAVRNGRMVNGNSEFEV